MRKSKQLELNIGLIESVMRSNNTMLEKHILNGANVNFIDECGSTPLLLAVERDNFNAVKNLIQAGADINVIYKYNRTVLYIAITDFNRDPIIKLLINNGANVNISDNNKISPLHIMAGKGTIESIKMLVNAGADVNAVNIWGETPLHRSVFNCRDAPDEVVQFLIESKVNVNIANNKDLIPLCYASQKSKPRSVNLLINAGSNINAQDNLGNTPIALAVEFGSIIKINSFIESGADLFITDNTQRNLLHRTAIRGRVNIMLILIQKGLNLNAMDSYGNTPMDYLKKSTPTKYLKYKQEIYSLFFKIQSERLNKEDNRQTVHAGYEFDV